jgi:hypothetical protein
MKNVFLDRIRIRVVTKVSSLLVLGVIIVAFLATPLVSLAHDNASSGSRLGGPGLFGNNGCLSQKDVAKCLIPGLGKLPNACGNDASDNGNGSNQDCGIPNLSNLGNICGIDLSNLLGNNPNNSKSIAAGSKQKGLANCGIPDLSNLGDICGIDLSNILGNNPNNSKSIAAGSKQKSLANCGIPDLSNLPGIPDLSNLGINGSNPKTISAGTKASSLPSAKLAGIVQFSAVQRQSSTAQQGGNIALAFKIVPVKVVSIGKGDFIGAEFNGKLESGISLGAGKADLFDPVTGQATTVQLI